MASPRQSYSRNGFGGYTVEQKWGRSHSRSTRAPFPIYRLDAEGKDAFFEWISNNVEFSDGYASNLRR
ncbi:hypothetical protein F2Q68_00024898 [Brassica cretica]|uniref:Uncharacterized protein n=1 Tax=Brassica cretica TaxID=69181 RepID=A0A8S9ID94_BRACR|nr:hypothetical protein F2Q68_00024898 [Brassica cretica]